MRARRHLALLALVLADGYSSGGGGGRDRPKSSLPRFRLNPHARVTAVVAARSGGRLLGMHPDFEIVVHNPNECIISDALMRKHAWEQKLIARAIAAMHRANASGHTEAFLDVGANLGTWSLSVAAAGFRVVAFEPMRYNTELLEESVRRNPGFAERYTLFKMAAVARGADGVPMCVRPFNTSKTALTRNRGNGQLAPAGSCGTGTTGAEIVPTHTIDSRLQSDASLAHQCFAAMKIDVEGHEADALDGAFSVMRGKCPPCSVLLEAQSRMHVGEPPVFSRMREHGYICHRGGVGGSRSDALCWLDDAHGGMAPRCATKRRAVSRRGHGSG